MTVLRWFRLVHGSDWFMVCGFFFCHGSWLIWPWVVADLVDLVHGFFLVVGCGSWVFFCLAMVGGCRLRSGGRGRLLGCGWWGNDGGDSVEAR